MRRRTEHRNKRQNELQVQVFPLWKIVLLPLAILILGRDGFCSALSPSVSSQSTSTRNHRRRVESSVNRLPLSDFASSNLFASKSRGVQLHNLRTRNPNAGSSSPSALHMVLTTPESIIEQASTVTLLDDLIDESVRTSARRPIMMQFDPSSGWVSKVLRLFIIKPILSMWTTR
jgi:hypothetical protein